MPHFALHIIAKILLFVAFYPANCNVLPCVLPHFTLRFAAFCTAFCCTLPCVLQHITPYFAANSAAWRAICIIKQH